ncbi:MAG: type I methionyl aminopeptidase [Sphingobacteriales bacterium]|nr:MAG: type I methionyl aminopeptidase [Sphingobacteriales bacterium]
MVHIKTNEEIALVRESSLLVSATLSEVASFLKPGMTTHQIDVFVDKFIRDHGAIPSFKGYGGFPFSACISVNDAVVHGFPNNQEIRSGDIISVDVGVFKNGFHGDSAYTFAVGEISAEIAKLLTVTRESLYRGIEKAVAGNRTGDIANTIQDYTEKQHGYGVVRELVGHGLGRNLHEDPQVPNFGKKGSGAKLKENTVIAIEPMINLGTKDVFYDKDGWTVRTKDGKASAHYEHTVAVKKNKAEILSSFDAIMANEKKNPELFSDY